MFQGFLEKLAYNGSILEFLCYTNLYTDLMVKYGLGPNRPQAIPKYPWKQLRESEATGATGRPLVLDIHWILSLTSLVLSLLIYYIQVEVGYHCIHGEYTPIC